MNFKTKTVEKTNEIRFFEKVNKIGKPLVNLTKKKKTKGITIPGMKRGNFIVNLTDIHRRIK